MPFTEKSSVEDYRKMKKETVKNKRTIRLVADKLKEGYKFGNNNFV